MTMKKLFDEYQSEFDLGMSNDINEYLRCDSKIDEYQINLDENDIFIINIKLIQLSEKNIKEFIFSFQKFISYCNLSMCYRENSKNEIKFYFYTSMNEMKGTKIIFNLS